MALLATFQDAEALPPEQTPEANRVIKSVIQFQSAFMKSDHPAIRAAFQEALEPTLKDATASTIATFRQQGWTSQILEAVVEHLSVESRWADGQLAEGFRPFYLDHSDFLLLSQIFTQARQHFTAQGKDIHAVFSARRQEMPGGAAHQAPGTLSPRIEPGL
jgi:hypothetical protein